MRARRTNVSFQNEFPQMVSWQQGLVQSWDRPQRILSQSLNIFDERVNFLYEAFYAILY